MYQQIDVLSNEGVLSRISTPETSTTGTHVDPSAIKEQLNLPEMSKLIMETVMEIDSLSRELQPLTPETEQKQLQRLCELERENEQLQRELTRTIPRAELLQNETEKFISKVAEERIAEMQKPSPL